MYYNMNYTLTVLKYIVFLIITASNEEYVHFKQQHWEVYEFWDDFYPCV